jgi:hypothetical protein
MPSVVVAYSSLTYGEDRRPVIDGATLYNYVVYYTIKNVSGGNLIVSDRGLAVRDPAKPGDETFINGSAHIPFIMAPDTSGEIAVSLFSVKCTSCTIYPSISARQWDQHIRVFTDQEIWFPDPVHYKVDILLGPPPSTLPSKP